MSEQFLYIICYDTPSDARRRRIVKLLEDVADRIQGSVFEGWMTPDQRDAVWQRLLTEVDNAEDRLRCYRCCSYCRNDSQDLQSAEIGKQQSFWIV